MILKALLAGGALAVLPLAAQDGTALAQASAVVLPHVATGPSEAFRGDFPAEALTSPAAGEPTCLLLPLPPVHVQVSGGRSTTFALALPGPGGLTVQGEDTTLRVQDFRMDLLDDGPGRHGGSLTLSAQGERILHVGASLRMAWGGPRGRLVGRVPLTLSYD